MTFDDYARRETELAFDALTSGASSAAREELNAMRAALEARMSALEAALAPPDPSDLVARLVQDLSRAAADRSDELVARARREARGTAEAQLAQAQQALEDARGQSAALTAGLEEARRQIDALQKAAKADARARAEIEAQLAHEQSVGAELSGKLSKAQAAASTARDEARERTADRLRALEARLEHMVSDAQALIERVKNALRAFSGAANAQAIFDVLVTQLAREFDVVALFLYRRNRLEGWRSHGLDADTDIANVPVPPTLDSPLNRAVTAGTAVEVEQGEDGAKLGVFGTPVADAVAWPVLVSGNVVAVAYVEHADDARDGDRSTAFQIGEVLVEHVGRCLVMGRRGEATPTAAVPTTDVERDKSSTPSPANKTPALTARPPAKPAGPELSTTKRGPTPPDTPDPATAPRRTAAKPPSAPEPTPTQSAPTAASGPVAARQVDRIKIRAGVEVAVDGATGQLVDLSPLGAQVLSPKSIKPQQLVRLVLQGVDGPLACKGRIMWARFEKTRPGDAGLYRAGMKFTDADQAALNAFLEEYGETGQALPAGAGWA